MKEVCPVPPPATVREPVTVGVNMREEAEGTIEVPKVRPLNARVEVEKVIDCPVVVEYPLPRETSPLLIEEVAVHVGTPPERART